MRSPITSLFALLGSLPLPLLHALGALFGVLILLVSGRYRATLRSNLSRALGRDASLREVLQTAMEAGKQGFESAWVWTRPPAQVVRAVRSTSGWETVQTARAAGRSILFLTPHLGCFEISAQYFAQREGRITVLFRPPRKRILAPLMAAGRNRGAMRAVPADAAGVRQLVKALKAGEAIGILPDQVPREGEGLWAPFFGAPAYTMTLAARLAAVGDTVLLLAVAERLPRGRGYHLHVEPATLPEGDGAARIAAMNRALEALIRRCPAQYLWGYNRYKCPPGVVPPAPPAAR